MSDKEFRASVSLSTAKGGLTFGKLLVAILLPASTAAMPQTQPTLQITSPSAGAIISPGQTLTVSVTSPTPASFSQVFLSSGDLSGFVGAISPLPGQISFSVPSSGFSLGTHRISVQGTPISGGSLVSTQVAIDVERPDIPSNVWSTLPGLQIDSPGEQSRLVLYADFQDGTTWRVTASSFVAFSSSNTAVATVDSSGLVTAVAAGSGFITAVYAVGGNTIQVSIPVNVAAAPSTGGGNISSFVLSASPGTESVTPGESASFALSVTSYNGFAGSVALSAAGLRNGITANFSADSVTIPGSSIVNFLIPSSAPLGTSVFTISGNSGSLTESLSILVTVSATPGAPVITALNPASGAVGASIAITGTNFRSTQGTSTVTFNGTAATPTSWNATSIVVPVPTGATTGNVVVTVAGAASNSANFTVTAPAPSITNLNPASGAVGTSVTVTGTNFGSTQGTSTVTFNGTSATPTSWSATSIVVPVPAGTTTGNVVVTVAGTASNGVVFTLANASVAFVQGNYFPQGSGQVVTVPFTSAQTAGNLNVVVVGGGTIQSLTDTRGNTYALAVGPTTGQAGTQVIYYAKNIAGATANGNAVTVTFTGVTTPDIRIAEYSGLDKSTPLDVAVGGQGNSGPIYSSGSANTTHAHDLLVGADLAVQSGGAGAGYTSRISTPQGNFLEDQIVTTTGSYSATANGPSASVCHELGGCPYIMQMVAFRAAN